jgi:hypothetical protein
MQREESERLDALTLRARRAHERIFELWRALRVYGVSGKESDALLAESARGVIEELPLLTARVRSILGRWSEAEVLWPEAVASLQAEFQIEMEQVLPQIEELGRRQERIERELRRALPDA